MRLSAGDIFDRYVIEGVLGQGGMGEVYRARDTKLQRAVALKLLRTNPDEDVMLHEKASAQLLQEARAAAALGHVNAVAIHDVGELVGVAFIAMELVSGQTLRAYVGDSTVAIDTRIRWLTEVGRALEAAHARGLIHRDIKPENVMVTDEGRIKVLDFGIARRQAQGEMDRTGTPPHLVAPLGGNQTADPWTHEGAIVGTPRYMAPEQLRGDPVDARTDQFSWGVMAYELLTGAPPWPGDAVSLTLVSSVLSDDPVAAEPLLRVVPSSVANAVLRALCKDPGDRFRTMDDAIAALNPPANATKPAGPRLARGMARRLALGVALVVSLPLFAVGLLRSRTAHAPSAASSTPAPAATSGPLRLTDLPVPSSDVAEARAAYIAGMHALREGSVVPAVRSFVRATELDGTMAAAHLRLIAHGRSLGETDVPKHFAKASQLRALLTPRDQALLWALEPSFIVSPGDEHEVTRRLNEVAGRWPEDCELRYLALGREADAAHLEERYLELLRLDPGFGLALWRAGNVALGAGDRPRALALLDRCIDVAANATSCLTVRALIYEEVGRCTDMERDARLLAYVSPSARTHDLVARALFANGAPVAAVREVLVRKWTATSGEERGAYERDDESHLAILRGDFFAAEKVARESDALVESSADEDDHKNTVLPLVALEREMGKTKEAASLAVHYLDARRGWQSIGAWSPIPELFAFAEAGGLRARTERDKELANWLKLWDDVSPTMRPQSWVLGYAMPAVTALDAREALGAVTGPLPRAHMNQFHREGLGAVGKVLLLGGRSQEALPELKTAVAACSALQAPLEHTRAELNLGKALEATGDVPAAWAAYASVLGRWGTATPRSVTADDATARRRALACP